MRSFALACVLFAGVSAVYARPVTPEWSLDLSQEVAAHEETVVHVALRQRNLDKLQAVVEAVSDPDSPMYAKYLTPEAIGDLIQPAAADQALVHKYLLTHGAVCKTFRTRDALRCRMTAAGASAAFGVTLQRYVHADGRFVLRSERDWSLPEEVAAVVELVHGVNDFPMTPRPRAHKPTMPSLDTTPASAPAGSAVNLVALSRGGPTVSMMYTPVCSDGKPATTVPPCSPDTVTVTWTATAAAPTFTPAKMTGTATLDASACQMSNGVAMCSTTADLGKYYDLRYYSVSLAFNGVTLADAPSSWVYPVVATPAVTPQVVTNLYSVPDSYVPSGHGTQSVVEFEQQYVSLDDLAQFCKLMGIDCADTPVHVHGFNNASLPGGEANLDLQWMIGIAPALNTTVWNIYANSTAEIDDILTWAWEMGNLTAPPLVNSLSYGMSEELVDKYQGAGYLNRSDVEFQKLAARGLTIIIADGDTGAGDLGEPPMSVPNCTTLHADWPSQSQYVTAIGSTYITPNAQPVCYTDISCADNPLGEVSVSMDNGLFWTTGGGFSKYTSTGSFQKDVVEKYLSRNDTSGALPPSNVFNSGGRAYSDAVAVGHNLEVVIGGVLTAVDGTSASAPIFAAVISLLNDARIAGGKHALGYITPLLYKLGKTPGAFRDVVVGENKSGSIDFQPYTCSAAFKATPGWDAVSGLGSPNFHNMLREVMDMP